MPKQALDLIDYFGPLACAAAFIVILAFLFFTCLNYCCVAPTDDITVVEEWGYHHNIHGIKLGPHRHSVVVRQLQPKFARVEE